MSDKQLLTYRERLAFMAGAQWNAAFPSVSSLEITEEALRRYPEPEAPVLTDSQGYQWRYNDSKKVIEQRQANGKYDWSPYVAGIMLTPERIKIFKELMNG